MITMEEGNFLESVREAICIVVAASFKAEKETRASGVGVVSEAGGVGVATRANGVGGDGGVVGIGPTGDRC
jgi:hypothetical protein